MHLTQNTVLINLQTFDLIEKILNGRYSLQYFLFRLVYYKFIKFSE